VTNLVTSVYIQLYVQVFFLLWFVQLDVQETSTPLVSPDMRLWLPLLCWWSVCQHCVLELVRGMAAFAE